MVRLLVGILLSVLLVACGSGFGPVSQRVVERAIALQFRQTQQEIVQQLTPNREKLPKFNIDQVAIAEQDRFDLNAVPTYRVQGTYRLTLKLPNRQIVEPDKSFDVYLQQQSDAKTWQLIRPTEGTDPDHPSWITYPLTKS